MPRIACDEAAMTEGEGLMKYWIGVILFHNPSPVVMAAKAATHDKFQHALLAL